MNYEQMSNNNVKLTGAVCEDPIFSHIVCGEGFYECKLAVKRLSEQVDILPITISERLLADNMINVGSTISIEGQFRSYNKIDDGKSRLMLSIFVRDIVQVDEVHSPNQIELTGFVCKQPVYRTTPFNREICDILLAVNRAYNKSDYIPCIAWGRNARFVKSISIGGKATIYGRIQSREYQKQLDNGDIVVRTAYEVSISRIDVEQSEQKVACGELELV